MIFFTCETINLVLRVDMGGDWMAYPWRKTKVELQTPLAFASLESSAIPIYYLKFMTKIFI